MTENRSKPSELKLRGRFDIEVRGPDGEVKDRRSLQNLVVSAGVRFAADAMFRPSSRPDAMSHLAIGVGTAAAATGQAALTSERARVSASYEYSAPAATLAATVPAGQGTGDITEVGVFNAGAAGTMLARRVFAAITKGAADSMTVTYTLRLT